LVHIEREEGAVAWVDDTMAQDRHHHLSEFGIVLGFCHGSAT
jgi:hypothetical protein